ncbi:MAG TPA: pyrroloquinoline quinone biosynthesis protein PqqB, partial [Chthoniobacteraceae bacterium]|nr:pyrroloquinoline quinone biosynthesis protein PqqB [Chthoniobacteraceae bacterium]
AAGGGLPQWNCACANCRAARAGVLPARTQSCVALSADGERWFLVNASPDLRAQIESFPALHARELRGTPIEAVLFTNADLDHVLGAFILRESGTVALHATFAVRETLATGLRLDAVLRAFAEVRWIDAPAQFSPLLDRAGSPSGISYRAIPLPGGPPPYASECKWEASGHSAAFQFADDATGSRLLIAPDVAEITAPLRAAVGESDAVLIDGTFWSDDELRAVRPSARTAREMGHVPISGGTLDLVRESPARYKAFVHINNTNPILMPGSRERAAVESAGVVVAEDGSEFAV